MSVRILVQPTPNPNALKFVLDVPVKSRDSVVFRTSDKSGAVLVPLAAALLDVAHVTDIYFSGSFITVTQDGQADWDLLEKTLKDVISSCIETHNPDFSLDDQRAAAPKLTGDLARIEQILDGTIRPALQHDGGDLQVIDLKENVLRISYQGACGCCPHAAMGTLYAIQNILREQFNPGIVVELA